MELEVEVLNNGNWVRVGEFFNDFDTASQEVTFQISESLIAGIEEVAAPDLSATSAQPAHSVMDYRLFATFFLDGLPVGSRQQVGTGKAIKAGHSTGRAVDLAGKAYIFLSTQPMENRLIDMGATLPVYVLPLSSGSATLQAVITTYAGQTETVTRSLGSVSALTPVYTNLSFPLIAVNEVASILISVTGLSGAAEVIDALPIRAVGRRRKQLLYRNSLGGYDSASFDGISIRGANISNELYEGTDAPGVNPAGVTRSVNNRLQERFNFRSGYMNRGWARAMMDMFLHNTVLLVEEDGLLPIRIAGSDYDFDTDDTGLFTVQFSGQSIYSEKAFSR